LLKNFRFSTLFGINPLKANITVKMDDPTRSTNNHQNFAGRVPAGLELPIVVKKNGVRHVSILLIKKDTWDCNDPMVEAGGSQNSRLEYRRFAAFRLVKNRRFSP
jgi:hypothetical protein